MAPKIGKTGPRLVARKQRLHESAGVAAAALAKMTRRLPVILKDVGKPEMKVLSMKEMADVRVDTERYQRIRVRDEVNTLIHVLNGGGIIPDPVTLARRPDGTLWVVDGQQRFWAHYETETPMRALIYEVPNIEAERTLFIVLNSTMPVNPNVKVHAWPGPVATLLRTVNDDKDHPMFGHINFGQHGARTFSAAPLMKALLAVMSPIAPSMPINDLLRRIDATWTASADARERGRAFLLMAHKVFAREGTTNPGGTSQRGGARSLPMVALASVARERWNGDVVFPAERTIDAIRRINWDTLVPTSGSRFLPVIKGAIEAKWRA